MKNAIKLYTTHFQIMLMIVVCLFSTLLMSSCMDCPNKTTPQTIDNKKDEQKNEIELLPTHGYNEIILFCGNPGSGKSTLCNTVFQEVKFASGFHPVSLTTLRQGHIVENKLYVDTPGLANVDGNSQERAAQEIEKALKKNSNYKLVFIITLEAGSIRAEDIAAINIICESIHTPFQYGLIINKITDRVLHFIEETGAINIYSNFLTKKPSLTLTIKRDERIAGKDNLFLTDPMVRTELINLINNLEAKKIAPENVRSLDSIDCKKKFEQLQQALETLQALEKRL
jgi:GTP-binding protein EngB required for normal cell division